MKQLFNIGFYFMTLVLISSCGGNNGGTDETPNAPSNVQAILLDGNIRISWQHDDKNVIGFVVYRNEGAPIGENAQDAQKIADTAADVKVYVDETELDSTKLYSYSVSAKGKQGESARVAIEKAIQPAPKAGTLRVRALFGGTGGKGTIKSSDNTINCTEPGGAKCSSDFQTGSTVTLDASPNTGSEFVGWQGIDCTGTGPCTVTVDAASDPNGDSIIEVTALFNQTGYVLTVNKEGNGGGTIVSTPSGINCGNDCEQPYLIPAQNNPAIKVGFSTVTVDDGSLFNGWGGACPTADATSSCVVTMDDDKTVTAFFSEPTADSYSLGEGETLNQDAPGILANDVALEGGVTLDTDPIQEPENGTLTLNEDGSFTYEHDGSNTTNDSFSYRVSDKRGNDEEVTVTLNISVSNDPPVANDDVYAVTENTTKNVPAEEGVLKNDSDDEGDELIAELKTNVTSGTLNLRENGSFIYTPDTNFDGTDKFTYIVKAGNQESAPATVTITVSDSNDTPVASDGTATVLEDGSVDITLNATDAETSTLNYKIVTEPTNGTLTGTGKTQTYKPNTHFNGEDRFTFRANDGNSASNTATVTITVTPVNDAPSFALSQATVDAADGDIATFATNISKGPANESGQTLEFILTRTDEDGGLEFSADPAISPAGTLSYTVQDGSAGLATFSVVLKDNGGTANGGKDTSSAKNFTITAEPEEEVVSVSVTPSNVTLEEGRTRQLTANVVTEGGADETVTWTSSNPAVASVDTNGLVTAVSASETPVDITATSTFDTGKSGKATVTVTAANQAPTANAGPDQSGTVGTAVNLTGAASSDADGTIESYAWILTTKPASSSATLAGATTATPSFTPDLAGTYTAQLTVTDDDDATDSDTVTISVGTANQPPTANAGANQTGTVGVQVNLNGSGSSDDDGTIESYAWTFTSRPEGSGAALVGGTTATPSFTPDIAGNYVVTLTVTDDDDATDSDTVTINVSAANQAPNGTIDTPSSNVTITEGESVSFTGTGTDPENQSLTYQWNFGGGATNSPVEDPGPVTFNTSGNYTVTFTVTDSEGLSDPTPATVQIQVDPAIVVEVQVKPENPEVNKGDTEPLEANVITNGNAPTTVTWDSADEGVASVNQNGVVQGVTPGTVNVTATSTFDPTKSDSVTVQVNGVLSVDLSPNPVPTLTRGQSLTLSADVSVIGDVDDGVTWLSSAPTVVTVTQEGLITAVRAGSALITATSSFDTTQSASVNITVDETIPIPENDTYTTPEDETLFVDTANGVLSNDGNDLDGVTVVLASRPTNGTLNLLQDGSFEYRAANNFFGNDSFNYQLQRGQETSEPAVVNLSVISVNDAPTTSGIQDVELDEDDRVYSVNLYEAFDDVEDDDSALEFTIEQATSTDIFANGFISEGELLLFLNGREGSSNLTIRARDTENAFVDATFNVSVSD